jgi:hypothetical protein
VKRHKVLARDDRICRPMIRFCDGGPDLPAAALLDAPVIRIRSSRRHVVPAVGDVCETVDVPASSRLAWEDVHRVN